MTIRGTILTDTVNESDCLALSGTTFASQGFNILGDVSSCTSGVASDLVGADPQILELGDFGGNTMVAPGAHSAESPDPALILFVRPSCARQGPTADTARR